MTNKYFLLVILLGWSTGLLHAQQSEPTILYNQVKQAQQNGLVFEEVDLFTPIADNKNDLNSVISQKAILSPKTENITWLYEHQPRAISVKLTTAIGTEYTLKMMRSNPLSLTPKMIYQDATGEHSFDHDRGVHYQGAIGEHQHSLAALSVFANGDVMILFANDEGNFVTAKLEDGSKDYVLYNDRDFLVKPETPCGTSDDDVIAEEDPIGGGDKTTGLQCNKLSLYWEIDYNLYTNKNSSLFLTQAYITGLFNQVQTLFRNEDIAVELTSIKIWTVPDTYPSNTSHAALQDFRNTWNSAGQNFEGDIATLVALDPGGNGGVAYRGGLCTSSFPYSYGDVNGNYNSLPTYSWDVSMLTHEIGHNISARHTHWCGWNTGSGGGCGSIDNCASQESGSGCPTCPSTYSNSAPTSSWQGTIMSYCHLTSRGINLVNGFGPLPGNNIRSSIANNTCMKSIISATLTPTKICRDNGNITLQFDTATIGVSNFGIPNYSYSWSAGNVISKDIQVVTPGTYSVVVTDSNGCSETFTTSVEQDQSPNCASTSVDDFDAQYVSIYPNPAHDKILIKVFSNTEEKATINVVDVTGKTIISQPTTIHSTENNILLNLSGVSSGVYYISIQAEATTFKNTKFIVQ